MQNSLLQRLLLHRRTLPIEEEALRGEAHPRALGRHRAMEGGAAPAMANDIPPGEATSLLPRIGERNNNDNPSQESSVESQDGSASEGENRYGCGSVLYYSLLVGVAVITLFALGSTFVSGDTGEQPLEVESNYPFMTTIHSLRPTSLWGKTSRPYPTGAWFTNLLIDNGGGPVAPLPYAVEITEKGVGVSYSAARRFVASKRVMDNYLGDLQISAQEKYLTRYLTRYDNLSCSMQLDFVGGGSMQTHLVRGSPYITVQYDLVTPLITSDAEILQINGKDITKGLQVHGSTFKVSLSNWETWMVYLSESVTMLVKEGSLSLVQPFSGILRVAFLPHAWDEVSEDILTFHANAYPVGGSVEHAVLGDESIVTYTWEKEGFGDLLMMALPHHLDLMDSKHLTIKMDNKYQTIKGKMTGIVGSSWELRDQLTTISWGARIPLADSNYTDVQMAMLRASLEEDIKDQLPSAPDPYGFGKQCGRMARLSLIAEEIGMDDIATRALDIVQHALARWLGNDNNDLLVYDKTWGGIVTLNGLNDVNADFGNANYNDHHFHYGYFLYAASVVIRTRPEFYDKWHNELTWLASDIVSDGTLSAFFPFARHKDWYDGHSWASGLFSQSNGKSQESVSEAVNAYYGAYLFGKSIGDKELRDFGRTLLAMEIRAAHTYWQMKEGSAIYDNIFAASRMNGIVASLEAVQLTWFGDNLEYVHGINMLPFTPITQELLPYDFMQQEWEVLKSVFKRPDPPGPQWAGYVHLAHAIVNKKAAWEAISRMDVFDAANSKSNSIYWVLTQPPTPSYNASAFAFNAEVDPSCQANSACFAQGLSNACCPDAHGDWLGCCPSVSTVNTSIALCTANPACIALGLKEGLCCPSLTGMYLGCCPGRVDKAAVEASLNPNAQCANNPQCATAGLEGACCPTKKGSYLSCCGVNPPHATGSLSSSSSMYDDEGDAGGSSRDAKGAKTAAPPKKGKSSASAACSAHKQCADLEGDCCPTEEGVNLKCCSA